MPNLATVDYGNRESSVNEKSPFLDSFPQGISGLHADTGSHDTVGFQAGIGCKEVYHNWLALSNSRRSSID